jgi:hypothetical protein
MWLGSERNEYLTVHVLGRSKSLLLLDSSTFRFLSLGWEDAMVGEKKANDGTTMVL